MTANEARQLFLDYFAKHNHKFVRSSSLIPQDDPTLLFTNAGMVQFKRVFMGEERKDYNIAVTAQKCVRAGGKHNDLENVGYTARHHTFFEMLGNFSFGDYFKEKAIKFAWDLLTNGYKLPVEKLWISVYLDDDEAFDIWHKTVGVSQDKIVRLGEEENFWSMGDTGPCGPCSEIHIDRGESFGCGKKDCKVGCECDRYLEIWNLVFMQFNRDETKKMTPLPSPSIDTGMGLERILSVVQNTPTNYETDLFIPIIKKIEMLAGQKIGTSKITQVAMKVIADHSRATAFLICDGVLPSNEGRGYVLRRVMRRAIRYGRSLGLTDFFLHKTVEVVFDVMKSAYPELYESGAFILNVIKNEELRFSETLDKGLRLLDDTLAEMKKNDIAVVPGNVIFKLYDTFGFPVEIINDVIKGSQITLDLKGYNDAMEQQRIKSRKTVAFSATNEAFRKLSAKGVKTLFHGYKSSNVSSKVLLLVKDGVEVDTAEQETFIELVSEDTCFYPESGGQVGDVGTITNKDGLKKIFEIQVFDTVKDPTGIIIHKCKVLFGKISKNDGIVLFVDKEKQDLTALNHTATHILHSVLRELLGDHIKQAGSFVNSERLRFDFTHFSKINLDMLDKIEATVNTRIRGNYSVVSKEMTAKEAFKTGATALFEEKYGDMVRVVTIGDFSKEFCGGIHIHRTGILGLFIIIGETSVASGVRRIEAITGKTAFAYVQKISKTVHNIAETLKENPEEVEQRIKKILVQQKNLEKELEKIKMQIASSSADNLDEDIKIVGDVRVFVKKVSIENPGQMRELADRFKDKIKSGVVVLGATSGSKVFLIVIVTKDLLNRYHAGKIIKKIASQVGGGGGGRPDMAQAGGSKPENLDQALEKVCEILETT